MRTSLEALLTRILDQQKFAEAKNALIATISAAGGIALITAFSIRQSSLNPGLSRFYLLSSALFFLATAFGLISFLPKRKNKADGGEAPTPTTNIIFFEHIARLSEQHFLEAFKVAEGHATDPTSIEKALANQIIVNSRITSGKHTLT